MSWPKVRLGEILREEKARIGSFDADGLPLLGVSNAFGLHRSQKPRIGDMSRYLKVKHNWFAYNPMRINVGSIGWAEQESQTGVISPDYVVFSCTARVDPKLVYLFLRSAVGLQAINMETAGSVRERLYFDALARIEMPLPPAAEQQRVVAQIEGLVAQIDEARNLRRQAVEEVDALISSARSELFGGMVQPDWIPLSHYVAEIENGKSPATEGRPALLHEWAVLRVGAVSSGLFDERENKALPASFAPLLRFEVKPGDFLMSRANTAELVGACTIVNETRPKLMLSDKIFRFIFREDNRVDHSYLDQLLKSPVLREQIFASASGTSPTMKNISKEKVLDLRLPPHSFSRQRKIVEDLDGLLEQVAILKKLQSETMAEIDALLPSVLDRAYSGSL